MDIDNFEEKESIPTRTPYIDENGHFNSYCDDIKAMAQAVKLALLTPRFRLIAFDSNYGSELDTLQKCNYDDLVFESEAKRRVKDALLCDERITDVYDFKFLQNDDTKIIKFSVDTIYGTLERQEVTIGV